MTRPEKRLTWFLRLSAVVVLFAVLAVVMPHAWMSTINDWCGFGPMPEGPLVEYLTRSLSALYALLGAYCWCVSHDVRRYLPILRFTVPVCLVLSVVLLAIDLAAPTPFLWTLSEAPFLAIWSIVLWWLVGRAERELSA